QVLASFDKELVARGWTPPPLPVDGHGGFVSVGYPSMWGNAYCADSATAFVSFTPAPGGGTYLKVQHTRNRERGICNPHPETRAFRQPFKFPTLLPIAGMSQEGGGGCSGSGNSEIATRWTGGREPLEVIAHYAKQ